VQSLLRPLHKYCRVSRAQLFEQTKLSEDGMMASQIMIMVVIEEDDTVVKLSVHYYCIIAAVEFVMTVDLPAANIGIHICISNTACSAVWSFPL